MGQVPNKKNLYLIIGRGRVANHIIHYLNLLSLDYCHWFRQKGEAELKKWLEVSSHVLVLIPDDQIEGFVQRYKQPKMKHNIWMHFSAVTSVDGVVRVHPLMTFSHQLYSFEDYLRIPFALFSKDQELEKILPGFPNPSFFISDEDKNKYHALCVLAGNFSSLLWQKFFYEMEKMTGKSFLYFLPYMMKQFENILSDPFKSLTGPLVRKDEQSIQSHLLALKDDPFLPVYQSFLKAYQEQGFFHENQGEQSEINC